MASPIPASLVGAAVAGAAVGAGVLLAAQRMFRYKPDKVWTVPPGPASMSMNRETAGARSEKVLPVGDHPIQLYSLGTPNGVKVTILLEELCELNPKFEYDAWKINIMELDQFTTGFVAVNPNSKIPALVDRSSGSDIPVFESAAIMVHLVENHGGNQFLPTDKAKRAQCLSWLFWQMGSAPFLGGGFGHFYNYAKIKIKYAIDRFAMEAKRQLDVLDQHLAKNKYMCGDDYTIADMAIWPWYGNLVLGRLYNAAEFLQVDSYTNVVRWAKMIDQRPAVQRGRMVNRGWGPEESQVPERHSRADFVGKKIE